MLVYLVDRVCVLSAETSGWPGPVIRGCTVHHPNTHYSLVQTVGGMGPGSDHTQALDVTSDMELPRIDTGKAQFPRGAITLTFSLFTGEYF